MSSSSPGYIDIDGLIEQFPKRKAYTYNARTFTYGGHINFGSSKYSSFGIKSFNGNTLTFGVTTTAGEEYTFKITNVTNTTELNVYDTDTWDQLCSGSAQNFYDTFKDTINWFPTSTTSNVTGSIFGDTINASGYTPAALTSDKGVVINGGTGHDSVTGSDFRDNILGGEDSDFINGGAGNDTLNGGNGNDTIIGGAGNDTMTGGAGETTYIYEQGSSFGDDTVLVTRGESISINGEGFESISGGSIYQDSKNKNDLIMQSSDGKVTIKNFLNNAAVDVVVNGKNLKETAVLGPVDSSYFVNTETHKLKTNRYTGTTIADVVDGRGVISMTGAKTGLTIDGGIGNDSIWGSENNDVLIGGVGNDTILGDSGNDNI